MQSLNFETLNIGDIVLTNPKLKWHNIGNMGLFTDHAHRSVRRCY